MSDTGWRTINGRRVFVGQMNGIHGPGGTRAGAEAAVLRELHTYNDQGREKLVALSSDGKILAETVGDVGSAAGYEVGFSQAQKKALEGKEYVTAHNHPILGTFSQGDFSQYADQDKFHRALIVVKDGTVHEFSTNGKPFGRRELIAFTSKAADVREELRDARAIEKAPFGSEVRYRLDFDAYALAAEHFGYSLTKRTM